MVSLDTKVCASHAAQLHHACALPGSAEKSRTVPGFGGVGLIGLTGYSVKERGLSHFNRYA